MRSDLLNPFAIFLFVIVVGCWQTISHVFSLSMFPFHVVVVCGVFHSLFFLLLAGVVSLWLSCWCFVFRFCCTTKLAPPRLKNTYQFVIKEEGGNENLLVQHTKPPRSSSTTTANHRTITLMCMSFVLVVVCGAAVFLLLCVEGLLLLLFFSWWCKAEGKGAAAWRNSIH